MKTALFWTITQRVITIFTDVSVKGVGGTFGVQSYKILEGAIFKVKKSMILER
jgi:hypothetical protein